MIERSKVKATTEVVAIKFPPRPSGPLTLVAAHVGTRYIKFDPPIIVPVEGLTVRCVDEEVNGA